jgi:hypothetical protein
VHRGNLRPLAPCDTFSLATFVFLMEHSCYKCGQLVADGKPFCAQCGAPQIRVAVPEPAPAAAPSATDSTNIIPALPHAQGLLRDLNVPPIPSVEWPRALPLCAMAALIAAVIMSLGLMIPLLAALGAGFLAVNLYHRRSAAWAVNARSGARLGAVCGAMFFAIAAVLQTAVMALLHTQGQIREKIMDSLQLAATRSNDPQVQIAFDQLKTPEGIALMMVLGLLALFVVSIAAGSLAGALTGAFLGRGKRS